MAARLRRVAEIGRDSMRDPETPQLDQLGMSVCSRLSPIASQCG
jgi:hypothetical protein